MRCVTAAVPHWKEWVDALLFCSLFGGESGGVVVMIAHVTTAPGHGLLFHSPTHTSTQIHILSYSLFQGISFLHTHRSQETLDPSRCPSVGVICVTPPLTPVCDSSPLITHTSQRANGCRGALTVHLRDKAVIDGILWPRGHRHKTHTRSIQCMKASTVL